MDTDIDRYQVHKNALATPELVSALSCREKSCRFDLVVTSPLFNEMGVMIGEEARGCTFYVYFTALTYIL